MGYRGTQTQEKTRNNQRTQQNQQGSLGDQIQSLRKRLARIEAGISDDKWLEGFTWDIELINSTTIHAKIIKCGKFNHVITEDGGKTNSVLAKQAILRYKNLT